MPVLFVYTERGGKTRVPFTSKISNQIAIYLNCTVNGSDFFFFLFYKSPSGGAASNRGEMYFGRGKGETPDN